MVGPFRLHNSSSSSEVDGFPSQPGVLCWWLPLAGVWAQPAAASSKRQQCLLWLPAGRTWLECHPRRVVFLGHGRPPMPTQRPSTGKVFWRRWRPDRRGCCFFGSKTKRVDDVAVMNMANEKFTKAFGVLMFFRKFYFREWLNHRYFRIYFWLIFSNWS